MRPTGLLLTLACCAFLALRLIDADEPKENGEADQKARLIMTRLETASDEDLRRGLFEMPEMGLDPSTKTSNAIISAANKAVADGDQVLKVGDKEVNLKPLLEQDLALHLAPRLMLQRPDLAGLPIRMGTHCRLGKDAAEDLQVLSRKLRVHLEASIPKDTTDDPRPSPTVLRSRLLGDKEKDQWLRPWSIPALQQLLMAESKPIRLLLVELLSRIKGREATEALALRAIFDLHADVRESAVQALKSRPRNDYQVMLTAALRYPWHPAVCHAAETLMALKMRDVVPLLVTALQEPDPSEPFSIQATKTKKQTVVRELVRINHLGNCMICHAHSLVTTDLVRGMVPLLGEAIPAPATSAAYYVGDGATRRRGTFVRADITYLKQDFSVHQPVENPGTWPSNQRYDYLVRVRALSKTELARLKQAKVEVETSDVSEHKKVLFTALRDLTGKDLGFSPLAWQKAYGKSPLRAKSQKSVNAGQAATEVKRMVQDLVKASGDQQEDLIRHYEQSKGSVYTDALARAIPKLSADARASARRALASRIARMTVPTLRTKLQDDSAEIRRAAILACVANDAKGLLPQVADLLDDPDSTVRREAHGALKAATGKDFGPAEGATKKTRAMAIARWKKHFQEID